jgi:hypothetical protein
LQNTDLPQEKLMERMLPLLPSFGILFS